MAEALQKANTQKIEQTTRDIDPNVRQRQASDPNSSIWVSASAGTGKTKVLTDRVLRLLLPRENGAPGTKPHKILGLTFTKAAASEMALRINEKLGRWAVMPKEALQKDIEKLLGKTPTREQMHDARKLFADVVDVPGGLKIMTIHSFCQSVLSRFPLEANLPPYFSVLEEAETSDLMMQAQSKALALAEQEKSSPIGQAFINIASAINEDQFFALLNDMSSERRQLQDLLTKNFGAEGLHTKICSELNIPPDQNPEDVLQIACHGFDKSALQHTCEILSASSSKTDQSQAEKLSLWLEANTDKRTKAHAPYRSVFFNKNGSLKKKLVTKSISDEYPEIFDTLNAEAQRLNALDETIKKVQCAAFTRDLLILGEEILKTYQDFKTQRAALDFDDLILKTRDLLQKQMQGAASWVLYKLDQGIDHILVDEAQDTNPDQWTIVEALCTEFFSHNDDDINRTLFVVGDEKQSIYSFQRASPEEFARMHNEFSNNIKEAQKEWSRVDLNVSFRSGQSVLSLVDSVFPEYNTEHISFRRGQESLVELWPLFENDEAEETDPWDPPTTIRDISSGSSKLAEHIAAQVQNWIQTKEVLPSRGRTINPGDIMILVRTRNAFVAQLMRALKNKNIPVSGSDRMILNTQLVIEDLLALAEFTLLPNDDLTLACVLKSPLIGLSEDELYALSIDRPATLEDAIEDKELKAYLQNLITQSRNTHPYEFFSQILQTPCPADERSGLRAFKKRLGDEVVDPIEEFLSTALHFEKNKTPSLQNFVQWQKSQNAEIKRELEDSSNMVRIMTVHGSKGLQAPIVILPDTTRITKNPPGRMDRRLIWPDKSSLNFPLFSPRSDLSPDIFKTAEAKLDDRLEEEYRRLLYVAMTRAEDRLYVGGSKGAREPLEHSWYNFVQAGLEKMDGTEHINENTLRLHNPQIKDPDRLEKEEEQLKASDNLPGWVFEQAPAEPTPPKPLMPSRPSAKEPAAPSPLQAQNSNRFKRGNLTHKLLEILPDIDPEHRKAAAEKLAEAERESLKTEEIIEQVLKIINHPEFAPVFGPGSQAEVPITALMPSNQVISGQIDRLLIADNEIWIIDYKTGQAPENEDKIPEIYKNQLQSYKEVIQTIYPEHTLHTALLWTDTLQLMSVTFSS